MSRRVSPREAWYRIVAGPFQTREEALKFIQTLKAKKLLPLLDCLPRKTG
jgi:cell division protein FtsN